MIETWLILLVLVFRLRLLVMFFFSHFFLLLHLLCHAITVRGFRVPICTTNRASGWKIAKFSIVATRK